MPKISALPPISVIASDDEVAINDVSANTTKKAKISELTGWLDQDWRVVNDTWAFSSFSSTSKRGVITVPSDATTKYSLGMRVRFAQATGGTKYGRIVAVTTTSITIRLPKGVSLLNEAITSPAFATMFAPYGYDPTTIDTMKSGFLAYYGGVNNDVSFNGRVPFNTLQFDQGSDFTLGASAQYVCPVDGLYQFNFVCYTNNGAGRAIINVYRSGVSLWSQQTENAGKTVALSYYCLAGDVVYVSGSPINFYGAINHNGFSGGLMQEYMA